LPPRFSAFRPHQVQAIEYVLASQKRFQGLSLPTGSGKTLIAVAAARALGVKTVYLTYTKALQEQIVREFECIGAVSVQGRANYPCANPFHTNCEEGAERRCPDANTSACPYRAAVQAAERAPLVITNYAYWLRARGHRNNALESGEKVGLLICDEAGEAPRALASSLSLEFTLSCVSRSASSRRVYSQREVWTYADTGSGPMPNDMWRQWANREALRILVEREKYAESDPEFYQLTRTLEDLARIPAMDSNWIWEQDRRALHFDPIRPAPYANALWSGVPRVLLLSATLRPYALKQLGLRV